jgi:hypothetical protein
VKNRIESSRIPYPIHVANASSVMPSAPVTSMNTTSAVTAPTAPAARKKLRLRRATTSIESVVFSRPASPRYRSPIRYWIRPSTIPKPAAEKPQCQFTFSPSVLHMNGPSIAPMLIPM